MRHFIEQMSPARTQQIIDEAYAAGRLGSKCLPANAHIDTSDSVMVKALSAHEAGLAERELEGKL